MNQIKKDMLRLIRHFKEPDQSVPHNFVDETGLESRMISAGPVDTFAYSSQIIGIKNLVDDALYRLELSYGQLKSKTDERVDKF